MNPQAAILSRLRGDAALVALLTEMPDDFRANGIYGSPLDVSNPETTEAFMAYPAPSGTETVAVPRPSIYVNPGRPVPHPQQRASGINTLTALYPAVWVYVPALPGEDGEATLRAIGLRILHLLDNYRYADPITGLGSRLAFAGTSGGISPEFTQTLYESHRFECATRWRRED